MHAVTNTYSDTKQNTTTSRRQNNRSTKRYDCKWKYKRKKTNESSLILCVCYFRFEEETQKKEREKFLLLLAYSVDKTHFLVRLRTYFMSQASRLVIVLQCGHKLSASLRASWHSFFFCLCSQFNRKSWRSEKKIVLHFERCNLDNKEVLEIERCGCHRCSFAAASFYCCYAVNWRRAQNIDETKNEKERAAMMWVLLNNWSNQMNMNAISRLVAKCTVHTPREIAFSKHPFVVNYW